MLIEISSLKEEIEVVERITDKKKVDEAKEMNKMQASQFYYNDTYYILKEYLQIDMCFFTVRV